MKRSLAVVCACFLIVWLAFTGVFSVALNDELYDFAQRRAGVNADSVAFTDEERMTMNRETVMYLAGKGDMPGQLSERAEMHMADVRTLFDYARTAMLLSLALAGAALIAGGHRAKWTILRAYVIVTLAIVVLCGVFALFGKDAFETLFRAFHRAVFTNDYWLLDPSEDALIRIMPTGFFRNMAGFALVSVAVRWLIGGAVMGAAMKLMGRQNQE